MADLLATLERLQINPLGERDATTIYVEHRTAPAPMVGASSKETTIRETDASKTEKIDQAPNGVRPGDRVVIRYLDENKTAAFTLSSERNDPTNGFVSVASPLGRQLVGLIEEDETEFEVDGRVRRIMIVRTERQPATLH